MAIGMAAACLSDEMKKNMSWLSNHHPAQRHQEERQEQPAKYPLQDYIVPVPAYGQEIDGTPGKEDHSAEEEGISKGDPLWDAIHFHRPAQGFGGAADAIPHPIEQAESQNGEQRPGNSIAGPHSIAAGDPGQNIYDL